VDEEGRGENEVAQPVNPATNAATDAPINPAANATDNAPTNPVANAPANDPANADGNVVNNATYVANVQANVTLNPRHNARAQPPPAQANRAEGRQRHRIRDEVETARRAN
jgi:hypothetical protein